jgi:hypothetical protein
MFDSEAAPFCWIAIAFAAICIALAISEGKTNVAKEQTKQFEIQLRIAQANNPTNGVVIP